MGIEWILAGLIGTAAGLWLATLDVRQRKCPKGAKALTALAEEEDELSYRDRYPTQLPLPEVEHVDLQQVNPATGLPMFKGGVDVAGHAYGTGGLCDEYWH